MGDFAQQTVGASHGIGITNSGYPEKGYGVLVALAKVAEELERAKKKFPRSQTDAHQGYAVLLEEVDEAWAAIKANNIPHAKQEMIQVAAMAIRFILEVQ